MYLREDGRSGGSRFNAARSTSDCPRPKLPAGRYLVHHDGDGILDDKLEYNFWFSEFMKRSGSSASAKSSNAVTPGCDGRHVYLPASSTTDTSPTSTVRSTEPTQ